MQCMTTLRLNREIEYKLRKVASHTKSKIIKELILNYLESYEENKKTPYELGMQHFGKVKTGNKNGSAEYKSIISEKIKTNIDYPQIRAMMTKYHDTPMDYTDAGLMLIGEKLKITEILTIDNYFSVYKFKNGKQF